MDLGDAVLPDLANRVVVRATSLSLLVLLIETVHHHLGDVELGMVVDHFAVEGREDLVRSGLIL